MTDAPITTPGLPPIGPCISCGAEILYGESYVVRGDRRRHHASCSRTKADADLYAPVGFKAAWDVWREETRFDTMPPEMRAAIRGGFVAGWKAKEATCG